MLIDSTYFINELRMPANIWHAGSLFVPENIEHNFIIDLLGYQLGTLVLAYNDNSEERIKKLVTGDVYVINGYTLKYDGLINTRKVSAIAYFIYAKYLLYNNSNNIDTGRVELVNENSNKLNDAARFSWAYNKAVELTGFRGQAWNAPSVLNYLQAKKDLYPECIFNELRYTNQLGL